MKPEFRQCEIRFEEDSTRESPGLLTGVLVVYGVEAKDRKEVVDAGAFHFPPTGVVVNRQHERSAPIVRLQPETHGNEVTVSQPLLNTTAGRDAALEVRGGLLTGLSAEMYVEAQQYRNGIRHITKAYVPRAALVDGASHTGSKVEVRESQQGIDPLRQAAVWL